MVAALDGTLWLHESRPGFDFVERPGVCRFAVDLADTALVDLAVGDFDGDGAQDVAVSNGPEIVIFGDAYRGLFGS